VSLHWITLIFFISCRDQKDCRHRVKTIYNPKTGTVVVERTVVNHEHGMPASSKSLLTEEVKSTIAEMFDRGLKPKQIRGRLLVSLEFEG
jgi:hypothetical protein